MDLPEWATIDQEDPYTVVSVDADAAYEAVLAEYRDFYAEDSSHPGADELAREEPTAYALEVAFQTIKMDVWTALGEMPTEIRMHDPDLNWTQADHEEERPTTKATPETAEPGATREAVEHYRRMRGYLPAAIRT